MIQRLQTQPAARTSKWRPVWGSALPFALCLATALAPLNRATAEGEQAKIALTTELDPFSRDDPRELYQNGLGPVGLSDSGLVSFYAPQIIFSGFRYLYQGTTAGVISRTGSGSLLRSVRSLDMNAAGRLAFRGDPNDEPEPFENGIYVLAKRAAGPVAREGDDAAGDGTFDAGNSDAFAGQPGISSSGHVAFYAKTSGSSEGIFLAAGPGAPIKRIARVNDNAQDTGTFQSFGSDVAVGVDGSEVYVAFTAQTNGTASTGLYLGSTSRVKLIAAGAHPDFRLNNKRQIVFENGSIFLGSFADAGPATAVVSPGDDTPGGGTFTSLSDPMINDAGQIAFSASGSNAYDDGIYLRHADGTIKAIAVSNQAIDGGVLDNIGAPEISQTGLVMFYATVRRGSANFPGIFLGNENGLLKVIVVGDPLLDSVVVEEFFAPGPQFATSGRLPGHGSLNSHGQVAYRAVLANDTQGIFLFTPALHWAAAGDGAWDTAVNWTLGLLPSALQNVSIDPATDLTVTGPAANTKVLSLKLGGGTGIAHLHLQPGKVLASKKGTTVLANGVLEGTGTIGGKLTLQTGANVALNIGGRGRELGHDYIRATGALTLAGTLDVALTNGFIPAPGDSFDLFDFPSRTGAFATIHLPALSSPAFQWDTSGLGRTGKLAVLLVPTLRGSYAGLIQDTTPALATSGPVAITVKANGLVTAKGSFGGKRFTFTGPLNELGELTGPLYDGGPTLKLKLDLASSPGQITGTISDAGTPIASLLADLAPAYSPRTNPNPFTGSYTVAFPPDATAPNPAKYPQGTGFATITVSSKGAVKLVGQLGDATTISAGGKVTARGEIPLYLPLYRKTGFLFGRLALHGSTPTDAVDGTLNWSRPASTAPTFYDAIDSEIVVEGSAYQSPSFPAGTATLTLTAGGIPAVSAKTVTIDAAGKVTTDPLDLLKLKLLPKGLFAGSFTIPGSDGKPQRFPFKGAVIRKQSAGKGLFPGVEQTGAIDLR